MPKLKTKKSISKRFKITANGKILRGHQYSRHRRSHKSKQQIRSYAKQVQLTNSQAKLVKSYISK